MAWHVILCSIAYIDAPNKGIEQACSWAICDIHISPIIMYDIMMIFSKRKVDIITKTIQVLSLHVAFIYLLFFSNTV